MPYSAQTIFKCEFILKKLIYQICWLYLFILMDMSLFYIRLHTGANILSDDFYNVI